MSRSADTRWTRRARWAITLLLLGVGVAFVPAIVAGDRFVGLARLFTSTPDWRTHWIEVSAPDASIQGPWRPLPGTSAFALICSESAWATVVILLALVPALFGWWRCTGHRFARVGGVVCALVATVCVVVLVACMRGISELPHGAWWSVPFGGALITSAFFIAPPPRSCGMSDALERRWTRRAQWAVALLLLGSAVAFVPGLAAGDAFMRTQWTTANGSLPPFTTAKWTTTTPVTFGGRPFRIRSLSFVIDDSLTALVRNDPSWAASIATLVFAPFLFLWWRRSAIGFGRVAGVAACVAAATAVCGIVQLSAGREIAEPKWVWATVAIGGALMAAAFLVAPTPRPRDDA
jgi:hypothetical protein